MRIKIRATNGSHVLTLPADATVATLTSEIHKVSSIPADSPLDIKYDFPPKKLFLDEYLGSTLLADLSIRLEGQQLTVSGPPPSGGGMGVAPPSSLTSPPTSAITPSTGGSFSFSPSTASSGSSPITPPSSRRPPKTTTEAVQQDPPDVALPNRGRVMLRVMEDDNSCLFRAVSYITTHGSMTPDELRDVVASTIQGNKEEYNKTILEQEPDQYCEWLKMETSWGGGIELGILAGFFEYEITAIDVSTGTVYRFNEGRPKRAFVCYSGIHYDAIALCPLGTAIHDASEDEVLFDVGDDQILHGATELCKQLRVKGYFTDTLNFTLKCNVCGAGLKGEKEAVEHAMKTGHQNLSEYR